MNTTVDPPWLLLSISFTITLVLLFGGDRVRRTALGAHLASAPLLRQLWRTLPFKALLFLALLGLVLRRAALGGLIIAALGSLFGAGFVLLGERISTAPLIGKLLSFPLLILGFLLVLAAFTLGVATFLLLAWDGVAEIVQLFGY